MAEVKIRRTVKVDTKGPSGTLELDGVDISNALSGFAVQQRAGHLAKVTLEPLVVEYTGHHGEALVHIAPEARDLLISLGWTPPAE